MTDWEAIASYSRIPFDSLKRSNFVKAYNGRLIVKLQFTRLIVRVSQTTTVFPNVEAGITAALLITQDSIFNGYDSKRFIVVILNYCFS
ncbi:MAG TPA: hypothetical protein V6D21_21140 [Candidatus Obscuribacterales bacterium]